MLNREDRGPVTVVTMAHGKANTMDLEFCEAVAQLFEDLERTDAGAVVLTGQGTIFSAGVDLLRVVNEGAPYVERFLPALGRALTSLFDCRLPVVAAVNGHAIAGGCLLAEACDHRIMAEGEGRIGVPELQVGVPFPLVAVEILKFATARQHLQELLLLGKTYTAIEALGRGLIDTLVPPAETLERAVAVAGRLAAVPRRAFALTKRTLRLPVLERCARHAPQVDHDVLSAWTSAECLGAVQAYVDRTLKKR